MDGSDDLVACVSQLIGLRTNAVEGFIPLLVVVAQGIPAVHYPDVIRCALDRPPVDLGVPILGGSVQTLAKRREQTADDFDVLLRHRPRSIARPRAAASAPYPRL